MLPHIRQIQRFAVEGHSEHVDGELAEGELKGGGRDSRFPEGVGCEVKRFCE